MTQAFILHLNSNEIFFFHFCKLLPLHHDKNFPEQKYVYIYAYAYNHNDLMFFFQKQLFFRFRNRRLKSLTVGRRT